MHKLCRHANIELLPLLTYEKYDTIISDDKMTIVIDIIVNYCEYISEWKYVCVIYNTIHFASYFMFDYIPGA